MVSPPLLEFDELLRPISDERPAGSDLRERPPDTKDGPATTLYYEAKEARSAARAIEDRARPEESNAEALKQWRAVANHARKALKQNTKDLDLVAWWIEALARDSGWAGLRDGFRLARELIERYWDKLYPLPDTDDGDAARLQQLVMLNGRDGSEGPLVRRIRLIPFGSANVGDRPLTMWSYAQMSKSTDGGSASVEALQAAIAALSDDELAVVLADLGACLTEWTSLESAAAEHCGTDALPSSKITGVLEEALTCWQGLTKDRVAAVAPAPQAEAHAASDNTNNGAPEARHASAELGPIQTREDAFRTLETVAQFFRRTEPHSPMPFVLERAIRWGKMPLPELLEEWMGNRDVADPVFKLIGIPTKTESS